MSEPAGPNLADLVGIPRADMNKMWEEVVKNHATLDACPRHDFSVDLDPGKSLGKHWRCTNCGGRVDSIAKLWYESGVEHTRGR